MLKFLKKREASVSIFLLIIMFPMFVFSFGIVDICKIMMAEDVMQDASDLAANSALTAYDKTLKDIYGLLANSSTEEELTKNIQEYYITTLETSGAKLSEDDKKVVQNLIADLTQTSIDAEKLGGNQSLLKLRSEDNDGNAITASPVEASAISNPAVMKRQIIEYSKYRGPVSLAIIPITLVLALVRTKKAGSEGKKVEFKKIFPMFILYFVLASVITTIATSLGVSASVFSPLKTLSKFFIVLAMCAVGLNTNIVKLIKTGGKPLALGFCCWVGIASMSLLMQHVLGIW